MTKTCILIILFLAASLGRTRAAEPTLPTGFACAPIATRITGATTLAIAPDSRVFICEQTGALRVVKNDQLLEAPFLTLKVDHAWERGLLGVAFDPDFAANHHLYINYVSPTPYPHHLISRFAADGDRAIAGSEKILFEGDDQTQFPERMKKPRMAVKLDGHQGGAIHFGPDRKLYVGVGEQTTETPAQSLDSLRGKILRLNPDGSIPADNPFYEKTTGKYRAIWAIGCRNPFCFAFQPETGRMFINDVGGAKEEINEGKPGRNFGWPIVEHGQSSEDPQFTPALFSYPVASITGGAFCPRDNKNFPEKFRDRYFFADFMRGFIQTLDPDHPDKAEDFASHLGKITDIAFAPDGALYVLDRNAWVIDKDFKPNTGTLYKITWTGSKR